MKILEAGIVTMLLEPVILLELSIGFKVRDRYESIVDKDAILPWMFIRREWRRIYQPKCKFQSL